MIEIIILSFLIRKVKALALEKGESTAKWIGLVVFAWFGAEILVFAIGMYFLDFSEEYLLVLMIPALGFASISAFFVYSSLKAKESSNLELDVFAQKTEENFDHFR